MKTERDRQIAGEQPPKAGNALFWIRHCAALAVLIGHSYVMLGIPAPAIFGESIHVLAIKVFFIISGYLVCKSWERDKNPLRYLVKRALRIFPGLAMVIVITAIFLGPLVTNLSFHDYFSSPHFKLYFWNIALAPDYRLPGVFSELAPNDSVNGSLWSLPVEFAMYLLIPIFSWSKGPPWRKTTNFAVVSMLFLASWFFQTAGGNLVNPTIYWTSIPFALQVAAFFACASWYQSFKLDRFLNVQAALTLAIIIQIFIPNNVVNEFVILLALPYIILALSTAPGTVFASLERFGDTSYGIYLYAFPVQQCLILLLGRNIHPILLSVLAIPITFAFAAASWHAVEKRALNWKPRGIG